MGLHEQNRPSAINKKVLFIRKVTLWDIQPGTHDVASMFPAAYRPGLRGHVSGGQKVRLSSMKRAAHKRTREDGDEPHVLTDLLIFYELLGGDVPDQLAMLA